MAFFLILRVGAIFYAIFISFWEWGLRGPREFLAGENYEALLTDPIFHKAIGNTLYYTAVWVPRTMALGLLLAVVVNQKIRGQTFFRAAFYFPAIASSAAITVLWLFIFAPLGLSTTCARRSGSTRCSRRSASGPSTTGSARATRRSTRSSR